VPTLALALLAGLRGTTHGRRALFVLPAAWLLGGVIGLTVHTGVSSIVTSLSLVLLGGLLAADARLPLGATTLLAALLGLGHRYLKGRHWRGPSVVVRVAGSWIAAIALLLIGWGPSDPHGHLQVAPSGLNHVAYAEVTVPAKQLSVQVQNFDYNRNN